MEKNTQEIIIEIVSLDNVSRKMGISPDLSLKDWNTTETTKFFSPNQKRFVSRPSITNKISPSEFIIRNIILIL